MTGVVVLNENIGYLHNWGTTDMNNNTILPNKNKYQYDKNN